MFLRISFIWAGVCLLVTFRTLAQINITKYASEDLFEVKPIVGKENLEGSEENSIVNPEISAGLDMWSRGDYDDAVYHFENLYSKSNYPVFLYYVGLINYERERFDDARDNFKETLAQDPLFLSSAYMLGMIDIESKNYKSAKTRFKGLIEIPSFMAHGFHGLGVMSLESGGSLYVAIKYFNKSIEADPTFIDAYIPLIVIYSYLGRAKKAREVVEKGINSNPKWEIGIMIRGMISLLQDEGTDQFEKDVNTLLALDPANYHYYSMKGYLLMEQGEFNAAISHFRDAYNLVSDGTRRGAKKFSSKFKKNESIQRSLNYYFDNYSQNEVSRKYLDRGICEFIASNKNLALQYLDSAVMYNEGSAVPHMFIGSIKRTQFNKVEEVIKEFTNALEFDTTNWIAYSYRGDAYSALEDWEHAYEDFDKVISLNPEAKDGYKNRGIILMKYGYFQHAYQDFSHAIAIDTTDTDLFFNRAMATVQLNVIPPAINDLNQIVQKKPNDGEAYYLLNQCYQMSNDSLQALSFLDSASKYSKYKKEYHEELIRLAKSLNNKVVVESGLNRLIKYFSYNTAYRLRRAKFRIKEGKYQEAIGDIEYALKRNKSGELYYYLGVAYEKLGDEKNYEKFIKRSEKMGYAPETDN